MTAGRGTLSRFRTITRAGGWRTYKQVGVVAAVLTGYDGSVVSLLNTEEPPIGTACVRNVDHDGGR